MGVIIDKTIFIPKSKELADKIKELEEKSQYLLDEKNNKENIDLDHIIKIFKDFKNVMKTGNYEQQHMAIKTFLKNITVDPFNKKIFLNFYELPATFFTSIRSGGGTRT